MTTISHEHRLTRIQQRRWTATCGQLDLLVAQTDHTIRTISTIRDQGAPEPVLEALTTAIARTTEARQALARAERSLWNQTGTDQ